MADVTMYVETGFGGTPDGSESNPYPSISSWEANETPTVNSPDTYTLECKRGSGGDDTNSVTINNITVNSGARFLLRAHTGSRHGGDRTTGYRVVVSVNFAPVIDCNAQTRYTIDGIVIHNTRNSGTNSWGIRLDSDMILESVIAVSNSDKGFISSTTSDTLKFRNCFAVDCGGIGFGSDSGFQTWEADNCGVANCAGSFDGINTNSSLQIRNCWSYNNTAAYAASGHYDTTNSSHNATDSASDDAPGGNSQTSLASGDFVDTTDFQTASGSTKLVDTGTDLSGTFTTSIDDTTRTGTFEIGPWTVEAGAPSGLQIGSLAMMGVGK